jgi:nitrous oxidase accessory protein NosD
MPEPGVRANDVQIGGDHYKNMGVEPWNVVDTWPIEQQIGYYRGGALKYLMRMGTKDESAQEIRKGAHYMQKLAEVLESQP